MKATPKFPCVLLILGAICGCSSEDAAGPSVDMPSKKLEPPAKVTKSGGEPAKTSEMLPATKDEPATPGPAKKNEPPAIEGPKTENAPSSATKLGAEEIANIKKLPAAEQSAALAQMVCPVSDGPLGAMGKPIKATAEGRTFYLCCDHCEDEVKSNPKAVIAKLDKK